MYKLRLSLAEHLNNFMNRFVWRWLDKYLGGHISIGNVTIYGFNAMNCAVNIWTKRWGYVCLRPIVWHYRLWGWYFYCSPDATPHASTFAIGSGISKQTKKDAIARRQKYGHNFDSRILHPDIYPEIKQLYPEYFENGV